MSWDATWHVDGELRAGYVAGSLSRARAASVEAHLLTCSSCRAAVAPSVGTERLDRNLAATLDRVDQPQLHLIERVLLRLGAPERVTRVVMVTPSARAAWLIAIAVASVVAALADLGGDSERATFAFLVAAPLLPLMGMTAVFSTRGDPARELVVAAPTPGFEVLLIRALAVLVPTVVLAAVISALVPERGWESVLWLLPSLGLTATTLALGSWFPLRRVAWTLGGAWVAGTVVSVRGVPRSEVIERCGAFRPLGQLVLMAVALVAGMVVVARRDAFDLVDPGRAS